MPTTSEANPAFMSALRAALQDLTRRHEVHIATRPQDTSIEAGWRQWGFRYSTFLSAYLASREPLSRVHLRAESGPPHRRGLRTLPGSVGRRRPHQDVVKLSA